MSALGTETVVYVTGGRQRDRAPSLEEWHAYECALVVRVDLESGECKTVVEYESPPDACPDVLPSHVFKCGSVLGDVLAVCTQTEVICYRLPDFDVIRYISHPWFNDLHHVLVREDGYLLVANTGLDMVLEITPTDAVGRVWSTVTGRPIDSEPPQRDYRKLSTTKPHRSHPNHVFVVDQDLWATRFLQRDAICLTRHATLSIPGAGPHDGLVLDNGVYFTAVDGRVVKFDKRPLALSRIVELDSAASRKPRPGWCRGLALVRDRIWVGFSRIRPTRSRQHVAWLERHIRSGPARPTSLAAYDAQEGTCIRVIELEQHGLNAVFSILRPHPAASSTPAF